MKSGVKIQLMALGVIASGLVALSYSPPAAAACPTSVCLSSCPSDTATACQIINPGCGSVVSHACLIGASPCAPTQGKLLCTYTG
jgi:hypothetical protein